MRTTLAVTLVVFALPATIALPRAQSNGIPAGANVYIENMDPEFEQDFREELMLQKVALNVVASRDEATFIVTDAEQANQTTLTPERPGALLMSFRRSGKVTVHDKATNRALWSGSWEVRSLNPDDNQKAARNLVGKLKKAVRRKK